MDENTNLTSNQSFFFRLWEKKTIRQLIRFGIIGCTGTIIDFAVLNLAVLILHLGVYLSASLGFLIAATSNFYFNKIWTFKEEKSLKRSRTQFLQFLAVAIIGFFLNLLILRIFLPVFGTMFGLDITAPLVLNLAKVIASLVVMFWNFLGSKHWVFKTV